MLARCLAAVLIASAPGLVLAQAGSAETYPERPIRFVCPLPPGGSPDTIARAIAQKLGETWPQPIVVENRTGGNQNIGADLVAKSTPDGYTWLMTPDNVLAMNSHLDKTPFNPLTDFTPVMLLARIQFLLVVTPSLPVKSVQELVAYAKANPGSLNYGSAGVGSPQHMGASLLQYLAGIQMNHVPYKGAAPAITDLLPGRIQVWIGAANSLLPQIKDGKLRLLASAGSRRYSTLPDVPTVAESGVPGYGLNVWLGLTMAAKVPRAIVSKVNAEVTRALDAPEVRNRLVPQGIELAPGSPAEFAQLVRDDYARWGKVIKAAGIKAEQ